MLEIVNGIFEMLNVWTLTGIFVLVMLFVFLIHNPKKWKAKVDKKMNETGRSW